MRSPLACWPNTWPSRACRKRLVLLPRALVRGFLLCRLDRLLLGGRGLGPLAHELVGLGLRHFARIDESGHAGVRDLLDVARHAGAQRLRSQSVLATEGVIVLLAIAFLAFGDLLRGN